MNARQKAKRFKKLYESTKIIPRVCLPSEQYDIRTYKAMEEIDSRKIFNQDCFELYMECAKSRLARKLAEQIIECGDVEVETYSYGFNTRVTLKITIAEKKANY